MKIAFLVFLSLLSFTDVPASPSFHETDWDLVSSEQGILTYQLKKSPSDAVVFRGQVDLEADRVTVLSVMNSPELRGSWMDGILSSEKVQSLDGFNRIEYYKIHVPWPFQNRDFVFKVSGNWDKEKDVVDLMAESTTHPDRPEQSGIVRGNMVWGRTRVFPAQVPGKVTLDLSAAIQPKGVVPLWLIRLTQKNWPRNTLTKLKKVIESKDAPRSAEIEAYFKAP